MPGVSIERPFDETTALPTDFSQWDEQFISIYRLWTLICDSVVITTLKII